MTVPPTAPHPTPFPSPGHTDPLPKTGAPVGALAGMGGLALLGGWLLIGLARKPGRHR